MFKYTPIAQQARELQKQNAELQSMVNKQAADIDYVAMMTDVELPEEKEQEVKNDEQ